MIFFVKGQLVEKSPTHAVIENSGMGYYISIPLSTFEALGSEGSPASLLTYLHVREDALMLFGFATAAERDLFKDLISVSGIGPKLALGILSGAKIQDFYHFIASGNLSALTRIHGLGKKTAQRLILDLKDKVAAKAAGFAFKGIATPAPDNVLNEAILALQSLGYSRTEAEDIIQKAAQNVNEKTSVEELLKTALKH